MNNEIDLNQLSQEVTEVQQKTGLTRSMWQHTRLVWRMFWSREVPPLVKLLPFAAVLYIISPLDFIPDAIPALGQLDDIGMLLLSLKLFINMSPQAVVDDIMTTIRMEDGELVLQEKTPEPVVIIDHEW